MGPLRIPLSDDSGQRMVSAYIMSVPCPCHRIPVGCNSSIRRLLPSVWNHEPHTFHKVVCSGNELPWPMTSEMVSTIPCGIVRHVHCATTPSGKALRHTWKCCLMRLWRVGTNTLYILRTTGSWFVRFVVQPYIYSFQGSDMFILPRTVVRVKAIHPTTDFIGVNCYFEFYIAPLNSTYVEISLTR